MKGKRSHAPLFPPPEFLTMPAVGIDISDRSIKYAELIPTARGHKLGRFGEVALPAGVMEGGRIIASDQLRDKLATLGSEQHLSFVRATLPEEQIYFFQMKLPNASREELHTTLELSLEDHVPIPAMEAVFDFDIASVEAGQAELSVTAASGSVIESYTNIFYDAGLTLLSLELEAKAVARAVIREKDTIAHLIVDFGETRTGIAIVYQGAVRFTSTVSVGGLMLTETLAKHFNISVAEAEKMKREFGLLRNTPNQDLFSLLLNNIAVLRDEINRHFIYWHTHADENGATRPPIEEIILVGGDSNLAGLPDYLSASLRVKTVVGDVWANVLLPEHGVPRITKNDSLGFATAIGLALLTAGEE